jgi:hypothetical protein
MHIVLYTLGWILGGWFAALMLKPRLNDRHFWLSALCTAYLVLLGIFGLIYQQLYFSNHANFVFANEIAKTRQDAADTKAISEKARLDKVTSALTELETALNAGGGVVNTNANDNSVFVDTQNYRWSFLFDRMWAPEHEIMTLRGRVYLSDNFNRQLSDEPIRLEGPSLARQGQPSEERWEALANSYFPPDIKDKEKREKILAPLRSDTEQELAEIKKGAAQAQWNYLDFFYSSTITQTTVGYGDILPNSSSVRVAVIFQVLIGLFMMGVGVALVTNGGKG